ncbi:MAG TPA: hypothetical protein VFW64_12410 [Pseudonocardiaceae bacterium]|nr:hypothetical protein [Pseudonocardiaceae bacterium]
MNPAPVVFREFGTALRFTRRSPGEWGRLRAWLATPITDTGERGEHDAQRLVEVAVSDTAMQTAGAGEAPTSDDLRRHRPPTLK